jgi:hypothetical protein
MGFRAGSGGRLSPVLREFWPSQNSCGSLISHSQQVFVHGGPQRGKSSLEIAIRGVDHPHTEIADLVFEPSLGSGTHQSKFCQYCVLACQNQGPLFDTVHTVCVLGWQGVFGLWTTPQESPGTTGHSHQNAGMRIAQFLAGRRSPAGRYQTSE